RAPAQRSKLGEVMTSFLSTSRHRKRVTLGATAAALALLISGCGPSDSDDEGEGDPNAAPNVPAFDVPDLPMKESVGEGEGELNVLAGPGDAESGRKDPA